jgi:hypothetical protein
MINDGIDFVFGVQHSLATYISINHVNVAMFSLISVLYISTRHVDKGRINGLDVTIVAGHRDVTVFSKVFSATTTQRDVWTSLNRRQRL